MARIFNFSLLLLLLLLFVPSGSVHAQKKKKSFIVVLDPGHGGHDPGAVRGKLKEKDANLKVCKLLAKKIEEKYPEVKVTYTRSTDVFKELYQRSEIANKAGADLFISVHMNAGKDPKANGVETFMWGIPTTEDEKRLAMYENQVVELEKDKGARYKDNDSDEDFILKQLMFDQDVNLSAELAQLVQKGLVKHTRLADRGVKSGNLYVLKWTAMPRILVEGAFVSNKKEAAFIASEAGQKKIADGIFEGFSKYYELYGKKKEAEHEEDDAGGEEPVAGKDEPLFKVQLFAADSKLKSNDRRFKGLKTSCFKEGKWYKYTYGETTDYNKALKLKKEASKKFKDAFIIAFINGKRVETSKAVEIFRKNRKKR